jgi:uncharacterized protein (DUF1778 family)
MTTKKKLVRKASKPRPDMASKKRSGYVAQSVRLTVEEAKLIRKAAHAKGESTNFWMTKLLVAAAKKQVAAKTKLQLSKVSESLGEADNTTL